METAPYANVHNAIQDVLAQSRREFVTNVLKTETFGDKGSGDHVVDKSEISITRSDNADTIGSDYCTICLEAFERGTEICSSYNENCIHAFHRECIFEWLLKNDGCPCCRQDFLAFDSRRNDEDVEAGLNAHSPTPPTFAPPSPVVKWSAMIGLF